LQQEVSTEDTI